MFMACRYSLEQVGASFDLAKDGPRRDSPDLLFEESWMSQLSPLRSRAGEFGYAKGANVLSPLPAKSFLFLPLLLCPFRHPEHRQRGRKQGSCSAAASIAVDMLAVSFGSATRSPGLPTVFALLELSTQRIPDNEHA